VLTVLVCLIVQDPVEPVLGECLHLGLSGTGKAVRARTGFRKWHVHEFIPMLANKIWTKHNIRVFSRNAGSFIPDVFAVAMIYGAAYCLVGWHAVEFCMSKFQLWALKNFTLWSPCLFLSLYVVQVYRSLGLQTALDCSDTLLRI